MDAQTKYVCNEVVAWSKSKEPNLNKVMYKYQANIDLQLLDLPETDKPNRK